MANLVLWVEIVLLSLSSLSLAKLEVEKLPSGGRRSRGFSIESWTAGGFDCEEGQPSRKRLKSEIGGASSTATSRNALTRPQFEQLDPEKFQRIKSNWSKNQEKLNSLRQASMELSTMKSDMTERLRKYLSEPNTTAQKRRKLKYAVDSLIKFQDKIIIFKQLRLLELGEAGLLKSNSKLRDLLVSKNKKRRGSIKMAEKAYVPDEIVELITQRAWKNFAVETVNELRRLVSNERLFPKTHNSRSYMEIYTTFGRASILSWLYVFKMIDFLYENEFLDRNSLQSFFQSPAIIRNVIGYTELRYHLDIEHSIFSEKPYELTEHWYWPLLHKSFEALGRKERDIINAYSLLELRHQGFQKSLNQRQFRDPSYDSLRKFFKHFDAEWYLSHLKHQGSTKYSSDPTQIGLTIHLEDDQRENRIMDDTLRIIKIIGAAEVDYWGQTYLIRHLYDLLDFIDKKITPGIMEKILSINGQTRQIFVRDPLWLFDYAFNIYKIQSKADDISGQARQYYTYIRLKHPVNLPNSNVFKENFSHYLSGLIGLRSQIIDEPHRLLNKLGNAGNQPLNYKIERLRDKVERLLHDIEEKYNDLFH